MCPQYTDAPDVGYLAIKLQNSTWYKWLNLSLTHVPKTEKLYASGIIRCGGIKTTKNSEIINCESRDCLPRHKQKKKQEAHGPLLTHMSDKATTDMQMLCNTFPILSLQLMNGSSFKQFLVLKKNIWAWQSMELDHLNKLSITFQQWDQCEIW